MILKIFRIFMYGLAGLILYGIDFFSFLDFPSISIKIKSLIIGFMEIFVFLLLLIALATKRFKNWEVIVGTVLVASSGVAFFILLSFICLMYSPELLKMLSPTFSTKIFGDYYYGGIVTFSTFCIGVLLVRAPQNKNATAQNAS